MLKNIKKNFLLKKAIKFLKQKNVSVTKKYIGLYEVKFTDMSIDEITKVMEEHSLKNKENEEEFDFSIEEVYKRFLGMPHIYDTDEIIGWYNRCLDKEFGNGKLFEMP